MSLTADANVLATGAAFIYVRVGNAWLEQTRPADIVASSDFNSLLTADGLTLFVGAEPGPPSPSGYTVNVYSPPAALAARDVRGWQVRHAQRPNPITVNNGRRSCRQNSNTLPT